MIFESNEKLKNEIKKLFIDIPQSQAQIARELNMSPSQLSNTLNKQGLSFVDVSRITSAMGYEMDITFNKKDSL